MGRHSHNMLCHFIATLAFRCFQIDSDASYTKLPIQNPLTQKQRHDIVVGTCFIKN